MSSSSSSSSASQPNYSSFYFLLRARPDFEDFMGGCSGELISYSEAVRFRFSLQIFGSHCLHVRYRWVCKYIYIYNVMVIFVWPWVDYMYCLVSHLSLSSPLNVDFDGLNSTTSYNVSYIDIYIFK